MIQALVYGNGGQESERATMVLEACGQDVREFLLGVDFTPVSYTHLTLPTNSRV